MKKHLFNSKIQRVLMTADTVGGVWTYALELAGCLSKKNIEVHLATMGEYPSAEQREQVAKLNNVALHASSFKLEWMENSWHEVEMAGKWLMELKEKIKPDLIHLNNYCHGNLPWEVPVIMVCHSCVYSWWWAVKGGHPPDYLDLYYENVKKGLEAADLVIAPTQAMLSSICEIYGTFNAVKTIPNGSSMSVTPRSKEQYVLCMGRFWDEAKNMDLLNRIAPQVSWPILMAGKFSVHEQKIQNRWPENLHALGKLNNTLIRSTLERAAIYVHPAKYEPFGLAVLEAAQAGCALLLSDIPSLRENWEGAAFFANPNNPQEFSLLLNMLIDDPELLAEYGERARIRSASFRSETFAESYLQVYQGLAEEKLAEVEM